MRTFSTYSEISVGHLILEEFHEKFWGHHLLKLLETYSMRYYAIFFFICKIPDAEDMRKKMLNVLSI